MDLEKEELLEVYNGNAEKTGKVVVRGTRLQRGEYSLSVHMFIYNKSGQFLLQKRSKLKKTLPGIWSVTCGAVAAGEDSVTAGIREAMEELGLALSPEDLVFEGQVRRRRSFIHLYFVKKEFELRDFVLQKEEVEEVCLCGASELLRLMRATEGENDPYTAEVAAAMKRRGLL